MRTLRIFVIAWLWPASAFAGAALLGCSARPDATGDATSDEASLSPAPPPTEGDACPSTRWVGKMASSSGAPCPTPAAAPAGAHASWVASPVFNGAKARPGLAPFCAYDWVPDGTGFPAAPDAYFGLLPFDAGRKPAVWLQRDCDVAAPLAPVGDPTGGMRRDLHRSLIEQVDAVAPPKGLVPVRVAVVDTSPDGESTALRRGPSAHGYTMGRLIENVTCPRDDFGALLGGDCLVTEPTYLGLPRTREGSPPSSAGGRYGSLLDVAQGIFRAAEKYRTSNPVARGERLVVNLSLGWEPIWRTAGSVERASSAAVQAAITHAACLGAIVVAAAGNESGGAASVSGPMYPAAWESTPAPTILECYKFEGTSAYVQTLPVPLLTGKYQPLVHAAGGVDRTDDPIVVARPASTPRLVAPAAQGVGRTAAGEVETGTSGTRTLIAAEGTDVLTGTSVAAALTSATAALVWSQRADLSAAQVMDIVYGAAMPLGGSADVCLGCASGSARPIVRRLDACAALASACSTGSCEGASFACAPRGAYVEAPPALTPETVSELAYEAESAPTTVLSLATSAIQSPDTFCGDYWLPAVSGGERRCPGRELYQMSSEPFAGSQPGYPECPSCSYARSSAALAASRIASPRGGRILDPAAPDGPSIYVSIDPSYGGSLQNATLRLTYDFDAILELDLAAVPLVAGAPIRLTTTDIPFPTDVVRAELVAWSVSTTGGKTSVTIPLLVN